MEIHPTQPQITFLWRTLQNYGADYEKITELNRTTATQLIGELRTAHNRNSLDPKQRFSSTEEQNVINRRTHDIRKIKDFYKL